MSKKLPMWIEEKGLSFKCTECGACCTGEPGFVWLTDEDIKKISTLLKLTEEEFLDKYCRKIGNQYSLLENNKTYDCIFLKNKKCTIYQSRPKQCRTYPFWDDIIQDKSSWDAEMSHCEGINHSSSCTSKEKILSIINQEYDTSSRP